MILEEMYNGNFYPAETLITDTPIYNQAVSICTDLMDTLSRRLSKEDYELVEELQSQMVIAQCEQSECYFKYGFAVGQTLHQEACDLIQLQSRKKK